jgi:hypothetical protein
MALFALVLISCTRGQEPCADRVDDDDCDGVPDAQDLCADSEAGSVKDGAGCSEAQTAGCKVALLAPEPHAVVQGEVLFRWEGDCDVYLLELANDERFPPATTRTVARTEGLEAAARGDERFFRVVGGRSGVSSGAVSEIRELEWLGR